MNRRVNAILAIALLMPTVSFAACDVKSGPKTAALVELYTSEGCSSCPPADKQLSQFPSREYSFGQVVPISLHVDYWDYIGWKDPFARGEFSIRQRKLAAMRRPVIVYTPQVLLQGQDFRRWASDDFAEQVMRINSRAARARIALTIRAVEPKSIRADLSATLFDPAEQKNAAVYLAAYENRLASEVKAGENRGRRLEHDFVVREWIGPIAFGESLKVEESRALPLLPGASSKNLGVAAFVQNRSTSEVLQALMLPACKS